MSVTSSPPQALRRGARPPADAFAAARDQVKRDLRQEWFARHQQVRDLVLDARQIGRDEIEGRGTIGAEESAARTRILELAHFRNLSNKSRRGW